MNAKRLKTAFLDCSQIKIIFSDYILTLGMAKDIYFLSERKFIVNLLCF